jgi:hypothetical protein
MGLGRCLLASFAAGPRAAALWCALLLASIDARVYSVGVQCNITQSVLVSCSCSVNELFPYYSGNETLLWTCSPYCRARRAQPTSNRLTYG